VTTPGPRGMSDWHHGRHYRKRCLVGTNVSPCSCRGTRRQSPAWDSTSRGCPGTDGRRSPILRIESPSGAPWRSLFGGGPTSCASRTTVSTIRGTRGAGIFECCPDPVEVRYILDTACHVLPRRDAQAFRRRLADLDAQW
jgi:hypothetical protein